MENRITLGIDNSLDCLSIVLSNGQRIIEERHIKGDKSPSEIIAVRVLETLENNGHSIDDIELLIVTLGPGSFTGIRVGLAFCKGLSSGKNIPLVGVPTLDVLAASFAFMDGYYVFPVIDAKKGEVFSALYFIKDKEIKRVTGFLSKKPEEAVKTIKAPCICLGTGVDICMPYVEDSNEILFIKHGFKKVTAEALIREGLKKSQSPKGNIIEAIYGRRSEAEIKFNLEAL
ncbi:MAG: tRNA (adenosine(37)-N6)-threonylcarbamoyltransferase complex dimerization subunit type 1 TsaB [Syntrophorhabdaceae bacterium]|nr:tRNA (adenosine(37)-N6)-threonylcarbamoyltransferase complex dimerization subunit type 1 TsaB [Syntrophorhabdaceae bacterium]